MEEKFNKDDKKYYIHIEIPSVRKGPAEQSGFFISGI